VSSDFSLWGRVFVFPVWVPLRPPVGHFVRPSVWWSAFVLPFVWVAPPPPVGRYPFLILATSILCMSSTASAAVLSHTDREQLVNPNRNNLHPVSPRIWRARVHYTRPPACEWVHPTILAFTAVLSTRAPVLGLCFFVYARRETGHAHNQTTRTTAPHDTRQEQHQKRPHEEPPPLLNNYRR